METTEVEEPKQEIIKLFVMSDDEECEFNEVSPEQLEQYLNERKEKERIPEHKAQNMYHQLAIIAKVDVSTTDEELDRLLRNDVRTILVQANYNKPQDIEQIFLKINTGIDKFYMENSFRMPIGVAVEINGEQLISGRLRNDKKTHVEVGQIIVLTTNEDYKYCCFGEIVYVSNLRRYLEVMKVGDIVHIGTDEIVARVVKCGNLRPLTVEVIKEGYLSSFMKVEVPYYIETSELGTHELAEVESAIKNGAHFLLIAGLKSSAYLKILSKHVGDEIKIIGSINFGYVESKFIDVADHIVSLDAVWMENMFIPSLKTHITKTMSQCRSFEKATLCTLPLKTCRDFRKLENHNHLHHIDCFLIEKSPIRKKYPLIAKKLLPVGEQRYDVPLLENTSCSEGIVNFVLRTISVIPCQGIVVSNSCPKAAMAFAIPQIYCPVICVVKDDLTARQLNLRRNLKTVVCGVASDPSDFGIAFGRQRGIFKTGDFIISISDCTDENSDVCLNLRAYYLPPLSKSDLHTELI